MKTDGSLSWKGLTLSMAFHGAAFVAAGWVLMKPAEVGVREAPVTAEFQVLADAPSLPAPASDARPADHSGEIIPAVDEGMEEGGRSWETPGEAIPTETGSSMPVAASLIAAPIPAGSPSRVPPPMSSRAPRRSAPHPAAGHRGATDVLPDYLNNPPPRYPEGSRLAGEQGVVLVRAVVGSSGDVRRVSMARSSGYPALDRAALEAVERWKFRPASAAGIAMDSDVAVPVRFELHAGSTRNP